MVEIKWKGNRIVMFFTPDEFNTVKSTFREVVFNKPFGENYPEQFWRFVGEVIRFGGD